jgi:hypothetical protein
MKAVPAFSVEERTIVAGEAAVGTGAVELYTADSAHVVCGRVPVPVCDGGGGDEADFHCAAGLGDSAGCVGTGTV